MNLAMRRKVKPVARAVKDSLNCTFQKSCGSLKDIEKVVEAFLMKDFSEVKQTRLYNKHSVEYCVVLELLNRYYDEDY